MNCFDDRNFIEQGILEWPQAERDTGRYGVITLYDGIKMDSKRIIIKTRRTGYGTLSAIVVETRKPFHNGDPRLRRIPKVPNVNDKFILGSGLVSYPDARAICVEPIIQIIGKPWMDIDVLYNIVNQTVRIYFTEGQ